MLKLSTETCRPQAASTQFAAQALYGGYGYVRQARALRGGITTANGKMHPHSDPKLVADKLEGNEVDEENVRSHEAENDSSQIVRRCHVVVQRNYA